MSSSAGNLSAAIRKIALSPVVYVAVSLVVLYLGYALNLWHAADCRLYTDGAYAFMEAPDLLGSGGLPDRLQTFDRYSEGLVVGRLVASRTRGLLSWGGFTGRFTDVPAVPDGVDTDRFTSAYQYKLYLDPPSTHEPQVFEEYRSQIGGQAFVLGVLDAILPFDSVAKLNMYYYAIAFLTAAAVTLVLLWFFREFGPLTGWLLTIGFSLLCYPTLYAKSLWWVIWAFYVPFVFMLGFYRRQEDRQGLLRWRWLFLMMLAGMLVKVFFNGCEYITTTIVMAMMPQCYYAVKARWSRKRFLGCTAISLAACVLAMSIFFTILLLQHTLAGETVAEGVRHVGERFLLRTYGESEALRRELGARIPVSPVNLLRWYATAPAVFDLRKMGIARVIGMKWMMIALCSATGVWLLAHRRWRKTAASGRITALLITLWLSMLAPCSWFVIFKGHSDVHRALASVVWYMPFMFYGIALLGVTLDALIGAAWCRSREGP